MNSLGQMRTQRNILLQVVGVTGTKFSKTSRQLGNYDGKLQIPVQFLIEIAHTTHKLGCDSGLGTGKPGIRTCH